MAIKSLKDLNIEGVDQLPIEDLVNFYFDRHRQSVLNASNVPSMAQLNNMIAYDYPITMLDNGNFAVVNGKMKVIEHNGTPLKAGINNPDISYPSGKKFIDNLLLLLKANSLSELAEALDVDEPVLHFMSLLESINARFLIYVHLHTDISIDQLMNVKK